MNPGFRHNLTSVAVLALFFASTPAFGQAADVIEGPIPDEVTAFRSATDRFRDRMQELEQDTRSFVAIREAEERERLVGGYDALIASLEGIEDSQRTLTLQRFEEFLVQYPDARYSSHVRFRLADLYYEVAALKYLDESQTYFEALESDDLEALGDLVEPAKELGPSIELYQKIIADNRDLPPKDRYERLDGAYVMLGFCYSEETSSARDELLAREAYVELIEVLPESDLADRAHLFLGNYLFADGHFEEAIAEYRFVYDKGADGPFYLDAMYQLAWAHYKQSRLEEATELFVKLLDESAKEELESGKESLFAPDAIKYMAYSFADMANQGTTDSVDIAEQYFVTHGARDYEWEIYVELADVLMRYFRFDEAIAVYEKLQVDPRWVERPENPGFQIAIVNLYARPEVGNLEQSGNARLVLTQRYNEGGDWWTANRNNPDALAKARDFIEASLVDVAIEHYFRAQESGDPAEFLVAAEKYQEYLDKFPIADDYYKQQWFLAAAYLSGGALDEAEAEYERMTKSAKYHDYGDGALYSLMNVRLQKMLSGSGAPDQIAENPKVITSYEPTPGNVIDVYELPADRRAFIESADTALGHTFTTEANAEEGIQDYQAAIDKNRVSLTYVPAQILFMHHQYEPARERALEILEKYPRSEEASYVAGLLVNSYIEEGDLKSVRLYSKRFSLDPPGPISDTPDDKFLNTLEGTTFKLAMQFAENGDLEGASEAFIEFRGEFPNSEYAPDALHNAAFYYQEMGKKERANELYEQFVNDYPENEKSRHLYFRIANNYEATFSLAKAVQYYEALRQQFPDDQNAADALYNASFLRIGMGQHLAAAQGFESYAKDYPDKEDREEVHWMAGEEYELVDDNKGLQFYQKYLRAYGTENPDHALEAQHRISEIYGRQGKDRQREKELDKLVQTFEQIASAGGELGPAGHRYAARAEFRHLVEDFEELIKDELPGDGGDKDATLVNDIKPPQVKEFEGKTKAFAGKYQNFEYNTGAFYLQGMAVLYFADLGLGLRPPPGLTEEQQWAFEDILQERVWPQYYELEEVGLQKLSDLIGAAKSQKKHSEWISKALIELNRRRPLDHPAVKDEFRGEPDARIPFDILPLEMDAPPSVWEGKGEKPKGAVEGSASDDAPTPKPSETTEPESP